MAHRVKYLALSLLWCGFDLWPENFHMPQAWPKKKKRKENAFQFSYFLSSFDNILKVFTSKKMPILTLRRKNSTYKALSVGQ